MSLEGPQKSEIKIEEHSFNEQQPNRSYSLSKRVLPESAEGYTEFWFDKEHGIFANDKGASPETLGENWKAFTEEMRSLNVTGMYINDFDNKLTIHINKSAGEVEPKWDEIEPKILESIDRYLLN